MMVSDLFRCLFRIPFLVVRGTIFGFILSGNGPKNTFCLADDPSLLKAILGNDRETVI